MNKAEFMEQARNDVTGALETVFNALEAIELNQAILLGAEDEAEAEATEAAAGGVL